MTKGGNILLVANWESGIGYAWWLMENFWIAISNHFDSRNITSHLAYPQITTIPESIAASGIRVHECNFHNHAPGNLLTIRRLIRNNDISYVYLSDAPSYSVFYLLLRIWGVRRIIVHDHTPGERTIARSWRKLIKSLIQRTPLLTADHFIAVTGFVCDRMIHVSCIPEHKCSIAPNGIKPLELDNAHPYYVHSTFGIPEDRVVIVSTGRASYYKGIDFIIECANELINRQGFRQLHFLFCGDGPDMDAFRKLVSGFGLDANFTLAGKRADIRDILPSCDIGLHAAIGEVGYSLSILEYMSAGLATIVPDGPSTSGSIRDGDTGLLYRRGDLSSACLAVRNCIQAGYRKKLAQSAISEVRSNYDIMQTNKKLISILEKVFS